LKNKEEEKMQVTISYMDGTASDTVTTTQTMEQITELLNTNRFVNIGTITVMAVKVNTVKEVTA
jgi:hypothetical protein